MKKIFIALIVVGFFIGLATFIFLLLKEGEQSKNKNQVGPPPTQDPYPSKSLPPVPGFIDLVLVNNVQGYREKSFYIGQSEVTIEQWKEVMGREPNLTTHISGRSSNHPVENISWEEAVDFCNALSRNERLDPCYDRNYNFLNGRNGYRLPTSNEWAMACFGNIQTVYPWGNDWDSRYAIDPMSDSSANWMLQSKTSPVKMKRPNRLGIHDMIGNVSEWCHDPFSGRKQYRTYRGGDWADWKKISLKSQYVGGMDRDEALPSVGFRVARDY